MNLNIKKQYKNELILFYCCALIFLFWPISHRVSLNWKNKTVIPNLVINKDDVFIFISILTAKRFKSWKCMLLKKFLKTLFLKLLDYSIWPLSWKNFFLNKTCFYSRKIWNLRYPKHFCYLILPQQWVQLEVTAYACNWGGNNFLSCSNFKQRKYVSQLGEVMLLNKLKLSQSVTPNHLTALFLLKHLK